MKTLLALVLLAAIPSITIAQTRPSPASGNRGRINLKPGIPTLWIIGDSTVKNGTDNGSNGQWGWGHPIASY